MHVYNVYQYVKCASVFYAVASAVQKKVAVFQQTAANSWQKRLWVLRISILPLNSPNGVFSAPNFVLLDEDFPIRWKFSDSPQFFFLGGAVNPILPWRHWFHSVCCVVLNVKPILYMTLSAACIWVMWKPPYALNQISADVCGFIYTLKCYVEIMLCICNNCKHLGSQILLNVTMYWKWCMSKVDYWEIMFLFDCVVLQIVKLTTQRSWILPRLYCWHILKRLFKLCCYGKQITDFLPFF